MWIKVLLVIVFVAIVASLASSLFFLVRDRGNSQRTVRALTWRVGLSVGLFLFIMLLVALDVIKPHGVVPAPQASSAEPDAR